MVILFLIRSFGNSRCRFKDCFGFEFGIFHLYMCVCTCTSYMIEHDNFDQKKKIDEKSQLMKDQIGTN